MDEKYRHTVIDRLCIEVSGFQIKAWVFFSDLQRCSGNSGKCCPVVLIMYYGNTFSNINHLLNIFLIGILSKEYFLH